MPERLAPAAVPHDSADWLDLSTPINPHPYPVPPIAPACWQQAPADDDGLLAAGARTYGNERLLAVGGAAAAIRALPVLFRPAVLAALAPIADAHTDAWQRAGHQLRRLPTLARVLGAATPNVLVTNPNPYTATTLPREILLAAAGELDRRGGWLIVDETLIDADPGSSVAPFAGSDGAPRLVVLRSLTPFFGLPGARVGFVFAADEKLDQLRRVLGPATLATPSRAVARYALEDSAWQLAAREELANSAQRLAKALAPLGHTQASALFCCVKTAHADALLAHFAAHAIRPAAAHGVLRFALPRSETDWQRLGAAIGEWKAPA